MAPLNLGQMLFQGVGQNIFSNVTSAIANRFGFGQETESSSISPEEARRRREQDAFYQTSTTETSGSGNNPPPSSAGNNQMDQGSRMEQSTLGLTGLIGQGRVLYDAFGKLIQNYPGTAGALTGVGGGLIADQLSNEGDLMNQQSMTLQQGGTITPIGIIRLSSKGNPIITRKIKSRFKSLADQVGLQQASNIAGIPLQLGAMILTKTFPSRERGVTGRELRQARKVVNKMKSFYAMIPTRTTSGRRMTTVARGVTQIKN